MIANEVLSKNPLFFKNRIQSKNGCFENGEDASVRSLDVLELGRALIQMNTPFKKKKRLIFIFLNDILSLITFHLPATRTRRTNLLSTSLLYDKRSFSDRSI